MVYLLSLGGIQRWAKEWNCFAKQQPVRARHKILANLGTPFNPALHIYFFICFFCKTNRSLEDSIPQKESVPLKGLTYLYFKGLNVGVLLLELDRIRESKEFNAYLTKEETTRLAVKYHMVNTHLGEQVRTCTEMQFAIPRSAGQSHLY